MVNEIEGKFDISGVHPWVKYGLAILLILAAIESTISTGYLNIIALGIAWFYAGPQCVKWAQQENHNQTWAFIIGVVFNLVGVFAYWLYKKRLSLCILGGIMAIILSIMVLILVTATKLPIIFPILQSYLDNYGFVGYLLWFIVWFIAGFIVVYSYNKSEKETNS